MLTHVQTSAPSALNETKVTMALETNARCDFESLCVGLHILLLPGGQRISKLHLLWTS